MNIPHFHLFVGRRTFAEKAMAPHSSTLAWKIPWMEEPGRLQSMGSRRVGHDWVTTFTFHFHSLEKKMATHSSVLAWRIPGTAEPSGLPSMGSQSRTQLKRLSSSSRRTFDLFPFSLLLWIMLQWILLYNYSFKDLLSVILDIYLGAELLSCMLTQCLTVWETSKLFPKMTALFCIPTNSYENSNFSISSPIFVITFFFILALGV